MYRVRASGPDQCIRISIAPPAQVQETYYILNGNVHMAPDLETVLQNRLVSNKCLIALTASQLTYEAALLPDKFTSHTASITIDSER